jgi:hypothetical protein
MRGMIGRVQHRQNAFSVAQMAVWLLSALKFIAFTLAEYKWIFRQVTFTMGLKSPWVFAPHGDVRVDIQAPPDRTQGASK